MMSLEEYANILSDFGLTHNQAKAYIAAVQLGIASISQVSKVSKCVEKRSTGCCLSLMNLG